MPTLTPEKEAEAYRMSYALLKAEYVMLKADKVAAEKEVERLKAELGRATEREAANLLEFAKSLRSQAAALSALPPPVPAEEGEPAFVETEMCTKDGRPCHVGRDTDDAHWRCGTVACGFASTQAPQDVAGLVEGEEDAGRELYGSGYHDGYLDGFLIGKGEDSYPDAEGEREISMQADSENIADGWASARVPFLSALRPSPISHEDRPLVLAAADAGSGVETEALVLVPREPTEAMIMAAARKLTPDDFGWATASTAQIIRVRYRAMIAAAEGGPVPNGASAAAISKAAFQSRQEGKQP